MCGKKLGPPKVIKKEDEKKIVEATKTEAVYLRGVQTLPLQESGSWEGGKEGRGRGIRDLLQMLPRWMR